MGHYSCSNLNRINAQRVRGIDDAARLFAHRLAEKYFGRGARCLSIQRLARWDRGAQYMARLGHLRGPSKSTPMVVTLQRSHPE